MEKVSKIKEQAKEIAWILFGILLIGAGVALIVVDRFRSTFLGVLAVMLPVIGLLLVVVNIHFFRAWSEPKREQKRKVKMYKKGLWSFPASLFYQECEKGSVRTLDTVFEKEKAKAIATAILERNGIPEEYHAQHLTEDRLKQYYANGKRSFEKEKQIKEDLDAKRLRTPVKAKLTNDEAAEAAFYQELTGKTGKEKRDAMLASIINKYTQKIENVKKAQKAMQDLAVMMAMSASEKKTADPAITAGIANGLGGAGAALYATVDVMNRNAQIEAENHRNREAVNQAAAQMYSNSFSMSDQIPTLEKEREAFLKARDALKSKIVIETGKKDELFKTLRIENIQIKKQKSEALRITAEVKTNYQPKGLPEGVRTVIDGTLAGKVYAGDLLVDEVTLPLPLLGVECGSPDTTKAETLCGHYAINGKPYRLEITPNDLWVMEL